MFFSIIIPVYNVAPYLRECLDSVLAQTFADWEAICVDDGSTDGSGAVLDEYASKDSRIKVVHKANEGVSVARNKGIELSSGEYFMFVDSDDWVVEDALVGIHDALVECPADGILVQSFDVGRGNCFPLKVIGQTSSPLELLVGRYRVPAWTVCRMYKRRTYGGLRFVSGMRLREDICFWSDALSIPAKWLIVDKPFYFYRKRPESASHGVTYKNAVDLLYFPSYVIRNMRERMGAGDEDVQMFWKKEVRTLGLDVFLRNWTRISPFEKRRVLKRTALCMELLGENPLGKNTRMCLNLANHGFPAWIVVLSYFLGRLKVRKKLFLESSKKFVNGVCNAKQQG